MKTLGTVDWPVLTFKSLWISAPSSLRSNSMTFASTLMDSKSAFVLAQKGQYDFEKTTTSLPAMVSSMEKALAQRCNGVVARTGLMNADDDAMLANSRLRIIA